jgi:hypothetical protein
MKINCAISMLYQKEAWYTTFNSHFRSINLLPFSAVQFIWRGAQRSQNASSPSLQNCRRQFTIAAGRIPKIFPSVLAQGPELGQISSNTLE